MKKALKIALIAIGWIGGIFFFLGVVSIIILIIVSITNGFDTVNNWWQVLYYSFAVIGSIGTFLAVYVALNKEKLSRILYSPELHFEKATGFPQPVFYKNSQIVEKYVQSLTISNKGEAVATDCEIDVVRVSCDKSHKQKFKEIPISGPCVILLNDFGKGIISKRSSVELPLFEVNNPNADSQPGDISAIPASIQFSGFTIGPSFSSMGRYRIEYRLRCKDGFMSEFAIEVDWIGEWSDDKDEMVEKFETKVL